jgi:exopolyphosphatase/guanosine-5'-triphosphate,3'-diphosphate pyrophosphatase
LIAAAIDVGTNSLKLLVARVGRRLVPLEERVVITRLGEGLARSGRISPAAAERTLRVLRTFLRRCRRCEVVLAAGTEAVRRSPEFAARVRRELGLEIRVLDGGEEGRLARLGGSADWPGATTIEIGGGSTQVSDGRRTTSLPAGAVTLTERFLSSDPPAVAEIEAARLAIRALLAPVRIRAARRVVALGGTASTIGAMWRRGDLKKAHGLTIPLGELESFLAEIASEPLARRRRRKGLEPKRADILVGGAVILTEAMRRLGAKRITLSVTGLRHGLLLDYFSTRARR